MGGTTKYQGRVEVCINKGWGGVCSPGWGAFDTRVVCRQLGHMELGMKNYYNDSQFFLFHLFVLFLLITSCSCMYHIPRSVFIILILCIGSVAYILEEFGKAIVPAFLSEVSCSGRESHLFKCPYDSYSALTCTQPHAGVKCEGKLEGMVHDTYKCLICFYSIM